MISPQDVSLEMTTSGSDKVKLSAPSSNKLSPFSPICPPIPIQQVSSNEEINKIPI